MQNTRTSSVVEKSVTDLFVAGHFPAEIGRMLNMSAQLVGAIRARCGLAARPNPRSPPWTPDEDAIVVRERALGSGYRRIKKLLFNRHGRAGIEKRYSVLNVKAGLVQQVERSVTNAVPCRAKRSAAPVGSVRTNEDALSAGSDVTWGAISPAPWDAPSWAGPLAVAWIGSEAEA